VSAVTPETDVIRKHRKEEIRDEEFKEQEIRIPGSSCPGSHYHGRDNIIRAVTLYYKNVVDREKLLEVTKKEMLILEYGVCRNTGN